MCRRDADTLRLVLEEKQALSSQLQQALASTRQTHLEHTASVFIETHTQHIT